MSMQAEPSYSVPSLRQTFRGRSWLSRSAAATMVMLILITGCGRADQRESSISAARPASPDPLAERASPLPTPEPPPPTTVTSTENWTRPMDRMVMVYVPGGTFPMGNTETGIENAISLCRQHYSICNRWYYARTGPQRSVSLDGFWLDRTEVTNAQYDGCVADGVCSGPLECKKGEPTFTDSEKSDHPVVCVDWHQAQAYCAWAGARLPTEAEWEYAFRGKQGLIYPWGDSFDGAKLNYCDSNCDVAHADDRFDDGYSKAAPAAFHPEDASWCGALDMGGNVSEWVADWLSDYSGEAESNPTGPLSGSDKVIRGGSWYVHPVYCQGAMRGAVEPDTRFDYLGFRCAVSSARPYDG